MNTKTTLLAFSTLLITAFGSKAQVLFENAYNNFYNAKLTCETSDGGYAIAGMSDVNGTDDMALMKIDVDGNVEWSHAYGHGLDADWAESVAQTLDGGYILVGGSNDDSFVVKTDANGIVEWSRYYNFYSVKKATDVVVLPDTSYLIGGGDVTGISNTSAGVARIDKDGDVLWTWAIPNSSPLGSYDPQTYRMIALSDGNYLAVGSRFSSSSGSGYAIKFDSLQNIIWEKRITAFNRIYSVTEATNGDLIFSGRGAGSTYGVLVKTTSDGTLIWSREFTESTTSSYYPSVKGVAQSANGDLLVMAHSYDGRCILIRTNSLGIIQESHYITAMDVPGSSNEDVIGITPTSDGAFLIARSNVVKKIVSDLSSVCGLTTASYVDASQAVTIQAVTMGKNNASSEPAKTFIDAGFTSTSTTNCSTTFCNVTTGFTPSATSICEGETVSITDNSAGGSSYVWKLDGVVVSSVQEPTIPFASAGSFTLRQIVDNGACKDSTEVTITVMAIPTVDAGVDQTICAGESTTISASGASTYTWDQGLGSGASHTVMPASATVYTVTGTGANGCSNTDQVSIAVNTVDVSVSQASVTLTAGASSATYQWLDCDNNYSVLGGETSQSFTATANGNYAVEVTMSGCTDTSACTLITSVGVEENTSTVGVYPNPSQHTFTVSGLMPGGHIAIFNSIGAVVTELVVENAQMTIDASSWKAGVYIIRVQSQSAASEMRLIKN